MSKYIKLISHPDFNENGNFKEYTSANTGWLFKEPDCRSAIMLYIVLQLTLANSISSLNAWNKCKSGLIP